MKTIKAALVASALALSAVSVAAPASAAVGVSIDFGNVAVGYNDGYWDNDHHWHRWAHREDLAAYRAAHAEHYHDMRHDKARNHGWER
ncbi:MAG TPA: hypothetical protein VGG48_01225 [Rhizomicrobium sp.]|jgi:Spy/CpxP family protein refolding chaperone